MPTGLPPGVDADATLAFEETSLRIFPGVGICATPIFRNPDGSEVPVPAEYIAASVDDDTFASLDVHEGCTVAIRGLAVGSTSVLVESGGQRARVSVAIEDFHLQCSGSGELPPQMLMPGISQPFNPYWFRTVDATEAAAHLSHYYRIESDEHFTIDDPSIATSSTTNGATVLTGVSVGNTRATYSYTPPGLTSPCTASFDVHVITGIPRDGYVLGYAVEGAAPDARDWSVTGPLASNTCYRPRIALTYLNPETSESFQLLDTPGSVFEMRELSGDWSEGSTPGILCTSAVAQGEANFRFCAGDACVTASVPVGDYTGATLTATIPSVVPHSVEIQPCFPITATLTLASGETRDVTSSPSLRWDMSDGESTIRGGGVSTNGQLCAQVALYSSIEGPHTWTFSAYYGVLASTPSSVEYCAHHCDM